MKIGKNCEAPFRKGVTPKATVPKCLFTGQKNGGNKEVHISASLRHKPNTGCTVVRANSGRRKNLDRRNTFWEHCQITWEEHSSPSFLENLGKCPQLWATRQKARGFASDSTAIRTTFEQRRGGYIKKEVRRLSEKKTPAKVTITLKPCAQHNSIISADHLLPRTHLFPLADGSTHFFRFESNNLALLLIITLI